MVEYTLLVTFVAIPTVAGITLGGAMLADNYGNQKARILASVP